jgi:hypothetical protein
MYCGTREIVTESMTLVRNNAQNGEEQVFNIEF